VGDEQKVSWQELLAKSRADFDAGTDLTVAVEEEFALLDPQTLELTNRFEEVYAAAVETDLAPHIVGELIASEVEVRTGRCEGFAEAAAAMAERRAQIHAVARDLQLALGGVATHPWSRWQDQRIIDTPHYRRNDEILRYVVWRNNTFGLHVHVGIAGADRAIAVHDALRNFLPEFLALSASSPFVEGVNSGLHSARTEIFTRMFPRCGIPDAYGDWRGWEDYVSFLYRTGSITEHTQVWWSVRPHLAFPTVEIRIADGQPDLGEAQSLAAFGYALAARCARAHDESEALPSLPNRLLEENLWRAIRYGLSGELLDFERGEPIAARRRIDELFEWVGPVADELGVTGYLAVPERNAAERQIVRFEEGASLQEIYAEQVEAGEPAGSRSDG
jgi:glutamate---cysteine ligase / carboxylate-amine ligase